MNFMLIQGLLDLYTYYGDDFTVECPTGSGKQMTLWQVSQEIALRLARIFCATRMGDGRSMAASASFKRIPTGATISSFMSIFMVTMGPVWAQATRRVGPV